MTSEQAASELRRLTTRMTEKAERGEELLPEDRQFHLLLMQTTGNTLAVQQQVIEAHYQPIRDRLAGGDALDAVGSPGTR